MNREIVEVSLKADADLSALQAAWHECRTHPQETPLCSPMSPDELRAEILRMRADKAALLAETERCYRMMLGLEPYPPMERFTGLKAWMNSKEEQK
jgi:hypothetical protein